MFLWVTDYVPSTKYEYEKLPTIIKRMDLLRRDNVIHLISNCFDGGVMLFVNESLPYYII